MTFPSTPNADAIPDQITLEGEQGYASFYATNSLYPVAAAGLGHGTPARGGVGHRRTPLTFSTTSCWEIFQPAPPLTRPTM